MLYAQAQFLMAQPWMHLKLTAAVGMLVMHGLAVHWRSKLIENPSIRTHTFFRVMNEIPTLLMIVIVVAVIVRPFSR
jgi:putative membrane protein